MFLAENKYLRALRRFQKKKGVQSEEPLNSSKLKVMSKNKKKERGL